MTITIDKAGRIVVPKPIRDRMHLASGTEFNITQDGPLIKLEPLEPKGKLISKNGIPVWVSEGPKVNYDVHAALTEDYERRADFQSGRFGDDRDDLL